MRGKLGKAFGWLFVFFQDIGRLLVFHKRLGLVFNGRFRIKNGFLQDTYSASFGSFSLGIGLLFGFGCFSLGIGFLSLLTQSYYLQTPFFISLR